MKVYYTLTKPGIIFGNLVTACGGFFLAEKASFSWFSFTSMLIGLMFVIASGCVLNNIVDQDIDALMQRTKHRALVLGLVSTPKALVYAGLLGLLGLCCLFFLNNKLTATIALFAWLVYILPYTLCLKRRSTFGVMVGGVAGALPPVVGYCAVSDRLDLMALVLFLILFFWQLPHFYAIGINRQDDFIAAKVPLLVLKKGATYTKLSALFFMALFTFCATLPAVIGPLSTTYFILALLIGTIWFALGLIKSLQGSDKQWARCVFLYSVVSISALSFMMLLHR